jgi:uncharacterized protein (DUF2235 family)
VTAKIAVFLDGTWNDPEADTSITELYRRARRLYGDDVAVYVEGVGVRFPKLGGGAFGWGLNTQIIEGYVALVERWMRAERAAIAAGVPVEEARRGAAEISLFGFSRGAFSARSLAGMIAKCGLLPPGTGGPDGLDASDVFARYRNRRRPGWREMDSGEAPAQTDEDRLVLDHARRVHIRFIGVFDTVGALGVPGRFGSAASRRYAFHDTNLSGFVQTARHALALDELRSTFPPTLWTSVPIPLPGRRLDVEQRWFVGAHSDVGGGLSGRLRDSLVPSVPREWMAAESTTAGLPLAPEPAPSTNALGDLDEPQKSLVFTVAAALPHLADAPRHVKSTALGETLDPSVLYRWTNRGDYQAVGRMRAPELWAWITERKGAPTP